MPEFVRLLIVSALGAALGAALVLGGFWALNPAQPSPTMQRGGDPDRPPVASVDALDSTGVSLEAQMSGLQRSQQQLLAEFAQLRAQVESTTGIAVPTPEVAFEPLPAEETGLSVERLAATGVPSEDAEALIQRLDELALARLEASYLIRQAATSGDPDLQRAARDARRDLPADSAAIRDEFGDSAYERYLYASGQPNRVEVSSVLRSSTAVDAGVEPGDYLRSLDGQPLYNVRDLTARIREGSPENTYALRLERDGQSIEVWVPGGPLGVRVTGASVEPGN